MRARTVGLAIAALMVSVGAFAQAPRAESSRTEAPKPAPVPPIQAAPAPQHHHHQQQPRLSYGTLNGAVVLVGPPASLYGPYLGGYYLPGYGYDPYSAAALTQARAAAADARYDALERELDGMRADLDALSSSLTAQDAAAGAAALSQDAARTALARKLQADAATSDSYRAAWSAWMTHWAAMGPEIAVTAERLRAEGERGCAVYVSWMESAKIAMPPVTGEPMRGLHQALYDTMVECQRQAPDPARIENRTRRIEQEVGGLTYWADTQSAYYSASAAQR